MWEGYFEEKAGLVPQVERIEDGMFLERIAIPMLDLQEEQEELTAVFGTIEELQLESRTEGMRPEETIGFPCCVAHELGTTMGPSVKDLERILDAADADWDGEVYGSLEDLTEGVAQGDRVFCTVSAARLQCPQLHLPNLSADRLVRVCGIDLSQMAAPAICLLDPYEGWQRHGLEDFLGAWQAGGNRCYFVHGGEDHGIE